MKSFISVGFKVTGAVVNPTEVYAQCLSSNEMLKFSEGMVEIKMQVLRPSSLTSHGSQGLFPCRSPTRTGRCHELAIWKLLFWRAPEFFFSRDGHLTQTRLSIFWDFLTKFLRQTFSLLRCSSGCACLLIINSELQGRLEGWRRKEEPEKYWTTVMLFSWSAWPWPWGCLDIWLPMNQIAGCLWGCYWGCRINI